MNDHVWEKDWIQFSELWKSIGAEGSKKEKSATLSQIELKFITLLSIVSLLVYIRFSDFDRYFVCVEIH